MIDTAADDLLRNQSKVALSGAEYVKDKLLSLLSIGPRSAASRFYAIKCRVKSEDSLIEKTKRKRKEANKQNYSPLDATDIVGLRILTIFSEELVEATGHFVDFVRFCQSPEIGLFHGHTIDEAVTEAIVFKSKNNTPAYNLVHSRLKLLISGNEKVKENLSNDDHPYSSIHLVCNAVSHHASKPKIVPLEVQIRTVFEDAWNVVDHPMRYKSTIAQDGADPHRREREQNIHSQLETLKHILEGCGKQADNIKDTQRLHFSRNRETGPLDRQATPIPPTITFSLSADLNIGTDIALKDPSRLILLSDLDEKTTTFINGSHGVGASELTNFRKDGDAILDAITSFMPEFSTDPELDYFLRMQEALIWSWRARVLVYGFGLRGAEFQMSLNKAIELYASLLRKEILAGDALLRLRLAHCLTVKEGAARSALEAVREAARLADDDPRVKKTGKIAAVIHRQHGYFAWKAQMELRVNAVALDIPTLSAKEQKTLLVEAIEATARAAAMFAELGRDGNFPPGELSRTNNNLISYLWELWDLDQYCYDVIAAKLQLDFKSTSISIASGYVGEMKAGQIDTLMKCAYLGGDTEKSMEYRSKLETLLDDANLAVHHSGDEIDLMRYSLSRMLRSTSTEGSRHADSG